MLVNKRPGARPPAGHYPDQVRTTAAAHGLGSTSAEFRSHIPGLARYSFTVYVVLVSLFTLSMFASGDPIGIGLGILLVALGAIWLGWTVLQLRRRVYLFESGFVYLDRAGRAEAFPWNDIAAVFQEIITNGIFTRHRFVVRRVDGKSVVLTSSFKGIERLGQEIQNEVTRTRLPRAAGELEAGQVLSFGNFYIDAHGISSTRGTLPWSQVAAVTAVQGEGKVQVSKVGKRGAWSTQSAKDIPNVFVFITLARELMWAANRQQ